MRYGFGLWFALALGLALMAGCSGSGSEGGTGGTAGTGGAGGSGGSAGMGGGGVGGDGGQGGVGGNGVACIDNVCPCTEGGLRAAIAEGGGPFTFDCDGPTTVVIDTQILIDKSAILHGEGNLILEGSDLLHVRPDTTLEVRGFTVIATSGYGIRNLGSLTLADSAVETSSEVPCLSAFNGITSGFGGSLTLTNTTVSGFCQSIFAGGAVTLTNSTISGLSEGMSFGAGTLALTNSTVSAASLGIYVGSNTTRSRVVLTNSTVWTDTANPNSHAFYNQYETATLRAAASLIVGRCGTAAAASWIWDSQGHNIESPGDTCGFDTNLGDQTSVTAEQLNLGPLQDNGGPTMTHALLPGSVAIDWIPEADCVDADGAPLTTDQRGEPRPVATLGAEPKCDVGAFEVQP